MSVEGHLGLWGYSCTSGSLSAVEKKAGEKDLLPGIQFCPCSQGNYCFVSPLAKKKHPLEIRNLTDCIAVLTMSFWHFQSHKHASVAPKRSNATDKTISIVTSFPWRLGTSPLQTFLKKPVSLDIFHEHTQSLLLAM